MLNIVLFGPPGAGKGTQAAKLMERYGLNHISTGEVIRAEIAANTPLGKSMKDYIGRGELAPDQLVIDIVTDYIGGHLDSKGNIFDGFPRTIKQAEALDKVLAEHSLPIDVMISLSVPDDEVVARLLNRGKDSGRADDFSEAVIRNRLGIYKNITSTVSKYYDSQGKYAVIDGMGSMEEIFERLCTEIESNRPHFSKRRR